MKKGSKTEQRIAHTLQQMRKAMPEIKRQVEVYEKSLKAGTHITSPKVAPQFKNV